MSLLEESFKTYIVDKFGITLDGQTVPKGSITNYIELGDSLNIRWKVNDTYITTKITVEEFRKLVEYEFIVDLAKTKIPSTPAKFKKGDTVKLYGDYDYIIESSQYNYETETWEYSVYNIWDELKKDISTVICKEEDIDLSDTFETDIKLGEYEYTLKLERILN